MDVANRQGGACPCPASLADRTLDALLVLVFSSRLVTMASVVSIRPAMLAALSRAVRTTFTGSMMPALNMSTYSPVLAS